MVRAWYAQNRTFTTQDDASTPKYEPRSSGTQYPKQEVSALPDFQNEKSAMSRCHINEASILIQPITAHEVSYYLYMAMCKPDDDRSPMPSQSSITGLIGTIERAAAEVSLVAIQRPEADYSFVSGDGISANGKKVNQDNGMKRRTSPNEVTSIERHLKHDENQANEVTSIERHLKHEENQANAEEEATTIGERAKRRRRSQREVTKESEETEKGHKRTVVNHNYHDYATHSGRFSSPPPSPEKKGRGGISSPFPMVLHNMLDEAVTQNFEHIVSWQPHGRCFLVRDQEHFVKDVMPMFFRQSRFSSFQRQLSLYGFLRLTRKNDDYSAYYHELFLRGLPHLCAHMQRTRVKGYWVRQSSSPETEPDFYHMSFVNGNTPLGAIKAADVGPHPSVASIAPMDSNAQMRTANLPSTTWGIPTSTGTFSQPLGLPPSLATSLSFSPEARSSLIIPPMPPLWTRASGSACFGTGAVDTIGSDSKWISAAYYGIKTIEPMESHSKWNILDADPLERNDLAAFLSDVDLATDDEDGRDDRNVRNYREEEELGRIFATNHAPQK